MKILVFWSQTGSPYKLDTIPINKLKFGSNGLVFDKLTFDELVFAVASPRQYLVGRHLGNFQCCWHEAGYQCCLEASGECQAVVPQCPSRVESLRAVKAVKLWISE